MVAHRVLLASPVLLALACFTPVALGDDSATAPTTNRDNRDWFRDNGGPAPSTAPDGNGPNMNQRPDNGGYGAGPSWVRGEDDRSDPRGGPGYGRRPAVPYNSDQDYPSRDMNDWVFANAHAATARAIFSRAENDLAAAYRRAQHNFERSKAYKEAVADEKAAYDNYTLARQKALRSLADDSKYKTLMQLRDDMADQLAQRRAQKDATKEEIVAMATAKMNYASDARAMEVSAINADGAVGDARQKMVTASQRVSQLRSDFDDSLHDNREIVAAHMNLEDARIALITAQAYLQASSQAGAAAMDYAYYLHRDGGFSPYSYGGYGYGYGGGGYGTPYWPR